MIPCMIISELWIGDLLRLKKSGRVGKFAGISPNQKIKVKVEGKVILTTPGNLEHAPDNHSDTEEQFIPRPTFTTQTPKPLNSVIDLHIEILSPSLTNARAERIIDFQVNAAQAFIEDAIAQRLPKIEIIHGKGAGVLKMEVEHLIYLNAEHIKAQFPLNKGGSIELWFVVP
ncbi:MAG: dsDNA-specific endonuclease/ATPase MutS2 [Saprospiraceae bacterium]|jgi:dsDNA-specific endonuclease/ATPase MutS2